MATRKLSLLACLINPSTGPMLLTRCSHVTKPQMSRTLCLSQVFSQKLHPRARDRLESEKRSVEMMVSDRLEEYRKGDFTNVNNPNQLNHFRMPPSVDAAHSTDPAMVPKDGASTDGSYALPHPIWSEEEVLSVKVTHKSPKDTIDWMAYITVKGLRAGYDFVSGYSRRTRDEDLWINRIIFLETVAGVPGMVAAMVRHLHSLRKMRRDQGWIHTLLEEAENERMHLMTALELKEPKMVFKVLVLASQAMFVSLFSLAYMLAPRYCHRFVGYLEEEAVITYTKCLQDIDGGPLSHWKLKPAPALAVEYWKLHPTATMKDVILAIRADEAHHRLVNHTLASMDENDFNPYKPGK